jgi:hypothetical protein
MTWKELLAGGVVTTTLFGVVGCEEKKSTVATNLSQPLPPAPVGSGGQKAGKAAQPAENPNSPTKAVD